jgi:uncharacterized protein (DUF4415 family)
MSVNNDGTKSNWVDPDDAPELDQGWFDKADLKFGDTVIRRGRPAGSEKQQIAIRLDKVVIEHFKAQGPGWQSRINAALRAMVGV